MEGVIVSPKNSRLIFEVYYCKNQPDAKCSPDLSDVNSG
jgi:hypothetical protein